jgi:hypothetical protein
MMAYELLWQMETMGPSGFSTFDDARKWMYVCLYTTSC